MFFHLRQWSLSYRRQSRPAVVLATIGCLALLVIVCSGGMRVLAQRTPILSEPPAAIAQMPDLGRHFKNLGFEGSILIYDSKNNRTYEHNSQRNATAFRPASTFKVFNSLVALETGVIPNDVAILAWDGVNREFADWNHDTNMRQALKNSTVWFYQILARRAGHERMQRFINQVGYGNRQIGTAKDIDRFWLEGPLEITPQEQIKFLQRLERGDLPFSKRTMDLVKDIMVFEQTPDYTLRAKTGWVRSTNPEVGWFVGYLEQNNNVYFFATNINIRKPEDLPARIEITRRSFEALGLL